KPSLKRRARLVIDRVRGRVYVMPAVLARIGFPRRYFVMTRYLVASLAKDAVRIEVVFQPFKASIVIRKIVFEILERVTLHLRALNFFLFCHARILLNYVPTVKG